MSTRKCYFSSHVESVRKDKECVFGILKKRWKILDSGIRFRDITVVDKIFVLCCILHNIMLSEMELKESDVRVRRGVPLPGDGFWLRANDRSFQMNDNKLMSILWGRRRSQLADHVYYCSKSAKSSRQSYLMLN